jgi:hypothetical protein
MLAAFKKNFFAYYSLLIVAFIIMMSLILFRLFGRLYPALSGVRCIPIMLLGDRVFYILVTWDPVCELSLVR